MIFCRLLKLFCVVFMPLAVGGCRYDPMDDYIVVEPVTLMTNVEAVSHPSSEVAHGQYLVTLLACGTCHTDGALVGQPDPAKLFGGSSVGIAYSNPFVEQHPGVLYPPNLTPDIQTGIGSWSDAQIREGIRSGIDRHGQRLVSVMPWPGYATLNDDDVNDIVAYLRNLKPLRHQVPNNVSVGSKASAPYVHFGVYQSKKQLLPTD
jgi:mono/diheme cytochrome c family protein